MINVTPCSSGSANGTDGSAVHSRMRGYSGCHMACCTCSIGSCSSTRASPSSTAVLATASATAADTKRRSRHRRQQGPADSGRVRQSSNRLGGGSDHPGADPGGLDDGNAEADAGKHQRVVGLSDPIGPALVHNRRERTAGCDEHAAIGPRDQIRGHRLGLRRRVGQRHDDGSFCVRGHVLDDRFGECSGLGGGADQDGRVYMSDDVCQFDPRRVDTELPVTHLVPCSGVGPLEITQTRHIASPAGPCCSGRRTGWSPPASTDHRGSSDP